MISSHAAREVALAAVEGACHRPEQGRSWRAARGERRAPRASTRRSSVLAAPPRSGASRPTRPESSRSSVSWYASIPIPAVCAGAIGKTPRGELASSSSTTASFGSCQKKMSSFAAGSYSTSSGCSNSPSASIWRKYCSASSGVGLSGGVSTRRTLPGQSARVGHALRQLTRRSRESGVSRTARACCAWAIDLTLLRRVRNRPRHPTLLPWPLRPQLQS